MGYNGKCLFVFNNKVWVGYVNSKFILFFDDNKVFFNIMGSFYW